MSCVCYCLDEASHHKTYNYDVKTDSPQREQEVNIAHQILL